MALFKCTTTGRPATLSAEPEGVGFSWLEACRARHPANQVKSLRSRSGPRVRRCVSCWRCVAVFPPHSSACFVAASAPAAAWARCAPLRTHAAQHLAHPRTPAAGRSRPKNDAAKTRLSHHRIAAAPPHPQPAPQHAPPGCGGGGGGGAAGPRSPSSARSRAPERLLRGRCAGKPAARSGSPSAHSAGDITNATPSCPSLSCVLTRPRPGCPFARFCTQVYAPMRQRREIAGCLVVDPNNVCRS